MKANLPVINILFGWVSSITSRPDFFVEDRSENSNENTSNKLTLQIIHIV